jgi:hypothetical protein
MAPLVVPISGMLAYPNEEQRTTEKDLALC